MLVLEVAEFTKETMWLLERALKHVNKAKELAPIERKLERALKKAFREQGRLFLERFAELEPWFPRLEEAVFPPNISLSQLEAIWPEIEAEIFLLFEEPIKEAILKAMERGGFATWAELRMMGAFEFAPLEQTIETVRRVAALEVTRINETTRDYIRTQVIHAFEEGWSYNRTAKAISSRFEEFAVGKPQEHIQSRAHLVAVTEVGEGYMMGRMGTAEELQAAGLEMEKHWVTVGDDKVSDGCWDNQRVGWIPLHQPFPSGHQRPLRFPGCRCDLHTRRARRS